MIQSKNLLFLVKKQCIPNSNEVLWRMWLMWRSLTAFFVPAYVYMVSFKIDVAVGRGRGYQK